MAKPCIRHDVGRALINDSGTFKSIFAISCTSIFVPDQAPAPTFAPASTSVLSAPERYTDENLQKVIKLALKLFIKGQKHD